MRFALGLFIGVCSAALTSAQPVVLSGPIDAFTFDGPTRSFRAVMGFPAGSSFGPALLTDLDAGSVAPRRNYAIAFQNGKCVFVSGLDSGRALVAAVSGVALQPESIVWSKDGSLAILFSRKASWFQTLTGFPNAPSAGPRLDVTVLRGSLASIAADAKGQRIAVGVSGQAGAVYWTSDWTSDRPSFVPLFSIADPIALEFSADGGMVYALDGDAQRVTAAGLQNSSLRTFPSGLADPVAILAVADTPTRELLYIAGRSDQLLRVFDVASQQPLSDIPLAFKPTRMDPLGSNSFVLAARSESAKPLWLLTWNPTPGAFFVPAIPVAQAGLRGVGGTE